MPAIEAPASDSADSPRTIYRAASECEAALVVGLLADHGVEARTVGNFIAGFRAEAPSLVGVVVREADAAEAKAILGEREDARAGQLQDEAPDEPASEQRPFGWGLGLSLAAGLAVVGCILLDAPRVLEGGLGIGLVFLTAASLFAAIRRLRGR